MLHPRTRVIFKAPVPHIHDTVAKSLIPWGMTYVIYIPESFMTLAHIGIRQYYYNLATIICLNIFLSISSWAFMSFLQQRNRQNVLQPLVLTLPLLLTTPDTVSAIQLSSGFTSKTTFRKYFIERYGVSPTEYRRNKGNKE